MDALSDVLRIMRLKGGVFLYGEFAHPWCLSVKVMPDSCAPYLGPTAHIIPYHYVLEGRMAVRLEDGEVFELAAGQSVLFPRNAFHVMGSDLSLEPRDSREVVERPLEGLATIMLGGGRTETRIVCGFLGLEQVRGNPVMSALPAALRLEVRDPGAAEWIRSSFAFAADRIAAGGSGSEVLLGKLSELLFVEAVQRYVEGLPEGGAGWLAGLKDPYVSRALALLHARLAEPWTVEALGREVGLSRSALAERFGALLGQPPMQYLANWRLHVAAHELIASAKSIAQIAAEVGYESEAAFARAFKRAMELPPAAWRRARSARGRTAA